VIEILDARIPISSKNPDLDALLNDKPRLVILNKSDLADERSTKQWINYFKGRNIQCLDVDSTSGKNFRNIYSTIKLILKEKIDKKIERGIKNYTIRAMVVGIPNVGKSSFINKISKKSNAKTGDKPGVTRSKQWIKVNGEFELLDTPGVLWPKFDDDKVALHLTYTRAIKDEILDNVEIALKFISEISQISPSSLTGRYGIELKESPYENLSEIGRKRGCIVKGGEIDTERTAYMILDDFRSGKLGRLTLELPEE
ncbi:MAG TPA: ribosome biogenesis GTPase YlqF, partial [Clostridiaceae bacterium]|nr:ribosome biogenesis GTPase YlqF [Clostridiaceae bacterium]